MQFFQFTIVTEYLVPQLCLSQFLLIWSVWGGHGCHGGFILTRVKKKC